MNATAVETLERRLDATRRALIGEQERLQGAREQAAHAAGMVTQIEDGIRKSEQIIADLEAALDELTGWEAGNRDAAAADALMKVRGAANYVAGTDELIITGGRLRAIEKEYGAASRETSPLGAPCPSCGAGIGDHCRSPNGEPVEPHATRGAPA